MPFDFPNSPYVGQQVPGPNNTTFTWDGVKWMVSSAVQVSPFNAGRNLLHNGLFRIQQRGAGPWTAAGSFTADRWLINFSGGTCSASIITLTDADRAAIGDDQATFSLQVAVVGTSGVSDVSFIDQHVENVRRTANKTITVSFWARATSGTPKLGVNLGQAFGAAGGGTSAPVWPVNGIAASLTTTWARFSMSFALGSIAGKTFNATPNTDLLFVRFTLSSGANNNVGSGNIGVQSYTLQLWGMQLEIASPSTPTPLEKVSWAIDLANCQRFYLAAIAVLFGGYAAGASGNVWSPTVTFPVPMRATPTIVYGTPTYGSSSGILANLVTPLGVCHRVTATAAGQIWVSTAFTAAADL